MQRCFFTLLLLLSTLGLAAHGIDGCISGNLLGGFTGYDRGNRIGIKQLYFNGSSEHINFWGQEVTDYGHSFATFLSGNIFLSQRWSVMANTSYYVNYEDFSGEKTTEIGLGDSRIMMSYTFYLRIKDSTSFSRASAGFGVELPTGKVASSALVGNFSTGSGSYDFPFSANYIVTHKNRGVRASGFYLYNGRNHQFSYPYKYGNAAGISISAFRNVQIRNWQCSFGIGPSLLSSGNDVYEFEPQPYTISNEYLASFVQGEIAARLGGFAINSSISLPVYTQKADELFDKFFWCELGMSFAL